MMMMFNHHFRIQIYTVHPLLVWKCTSILLKRSTYAEAVPTAKKRKCILTFSSEAIPFPKYTVYMFLHLYFCLEVVSTRTSCWWHSTRTGSQQARSASRCHANQQQWATRNKRNLLKACCCLHLSSRLHTAVVRFHHEIKCPNKQSIH